MNTEQKHKTSQLISFSEKQGFKNTLCGSLQPGWLIWKRDHVVLLGLNKHPAFIAQEMNNVEVY